MTDDTAQTPEVGRHAGGGPVEHTVGRPGPERADGPWEADRHWPRRACYPQWFVRRRLSNTDFEFVVNEAGRRKRFRSLDAAAREADSRNKTPNVAGKAPAR